MSSGIVTSDIMYDTDGNRILTLFPYVFQDPVSKYWYLYGYEEDGSTTVRQFGNRIYRSADLLNWQYRATMLNSASGEVAPGNGFGLMQVLYNALNNNYVAWFHL